MIGVVTGDAKSLDHSAVGPMTLAWPDQQEALEELEDPTRTTS